MLFCGVCDISSNFTVFTQDGVWVGCLHHSDGSATGKWGISSSVFTDFTVLTVFTVDVFVGSELWSMPARGLWYHMKYFHKFHSCFHFLIWFHLWKGGGSKLSKCFHYVICFHSLWLGVGVSLRVFSMCSLFSLGWCGVWDINPQFTLFTVFTRDVSMFSLLGDGWWVVWDISARVFPVFTHFTRGFGWCVISLHFWLFSLGFWWSLRREWMVCFGYLIVCFYCFHCFH